MPAYTFPATANVVALAGAKPVLVDVDPETLNLDPSACRGRSRRGRRRCWRCTSSAARSTGRRSRTPCRRSCRCSRTRPARSARAGAGVPCGGARARSAASASTRARSSRPARAARSRRTTPSSPTRSAACATTAGSHADARHAAPGAQLPALGRPLRARHPAAARGSTSCSRRATRVAAGVRGAARASCRRRCPAPTRATCTAGRPTSSGSTAATRCCAALRAEGIEAQIGTYALHRLGAYRDQGPFPGADAAFERALALPFHTRLTDARARPRRARASRGA